MTDRLDLSTGSSLTTTWSPDHRREWYEKNTEIKLLQLSSSFLILAHVLSRAQTGSRGLIFRMRTDVHRPHAAYSTILDPLRPPPRPSPLSYIHSRKRSDNLHRNDLAKERATSLVSDRAILRVTVISYNRRPGGPVTTMTTATGWTITEGGDFGALERLNEESERRLVNDLATLCDRYTCVALFSFSSRWFFVAGIGMWAYGPNWAGGQAFRRYERSRSDTVRARGRCLPLIRPFSAGAGALLSRASSMPSWVRGRPERSTTGICLSPCLSLSLSLSLSPLSPSFSFSVLTNGRATRLSPGRVEGPGDEDRSHAPTIPSTRRHIGAPFTAAPFALLRVVSAFYLSAYDRTAYRAWESAHRAPR